MGTINLHLKRAFYSHQGLVVPVIRNVETMNYADIERTISELGEKVKWKGVCELQGRSGKRPWEGWASERCSGSWSFPLL